jgi:hypothetical protein
MFRVVVAIVGMVLITVLNLLRASGWHRDTTAATRFPPFVTAGWDAGAGNRPA